jgi:hypothetical protein
MTDDERYIAQGRAQDAAKKLRSEIAALRTFFDEYAESLETLKSILSRFLIEPAAKAPDQRMLIDHLNQQQRQVSNGGFFDKTAEFMEKTRKLRDLEEQIKHF